MHSRSHIRALMIAAVVAAVALTAAGSAGSAPASGKQATACRELTKLTLSYNAPVGDELPVWIADDAGYFTQNCLDVTVANVGGANGVPALISGKTQIASIGGQEALSAKAQGADITYFLTLMPVFPFQLWAWPQFASAGGLKGQRIGISTPVGSLYTGTILALKQLGLAPSDVQLVPLGSVPNVNSALAAGSVAAAASHPPSTLTFRQQGLKMLVDLVKQHIPAVNTGLAAQTSYIQQNPDVIQRVVLSVMQALQRAKTDKAYVAQEMRKYMHVTDLATADDTYDFYITEAMPAVPLVTVAQLRTTQQDLAATNAAVGQLNLSSLVDQGFVAKAAKQMGLDQASIAKAKKIAKLHTWIVQQRKKGVSWAKIKKSPNFRLWLKLKFSGK